MNRFLAPLLAPVLLTAALTGCVRYNIAGDGISRLRIGETGTVTQGVTITPLKLLEDSRCAAGVQCVWAGQVRVSVRLDTGAASETREFTSDKPQSVAGGTLVLAEVYPGKVKNVTIFPEEYRFGFTFRK
jgi:hypothetical protein